MLYHYRNDAPVITLRALFPGSSSLRAFIQKSAPKIRRAFIPHDCEFASLTFRAKKICCIILNKAEFARVKCNSSSIRLGWASLG